MLFHLEPALSNIQKGNIFSQIFLFLFNALFQSVLLYPCFRAPQPWYLEGQTSFCSFHLTPIVLKTHSSYFSALRVPHKSSPCSQEKATEFCFSLLFSQATALFLSRILLRPLRRQDLRNSKMLRTSVSSEANGKIYFMAESVFLYSLVLLVVLKHRISEIVLYRGSIKEMCPLL